MTADVVAGRFALCDPIGSGGSGTVWRAFDRKRGGYCAAKLLRQRDAGDLLRFVREQAVRLDHPNIVSPYSWVAEDGTVLIASELMTGGSLHTLLGDWGPLAESTVVSVLAQVLSGLQAVHDAELIHRDVKPANLLLQATGDGPIHVVLTDFGLTISRLDARLTQVGMVIGTPGYVPPEVLMGGVPPDPRHDLYAVGRMALTMLAGQEPYGPMENLAGSIQDAALRGTVEALLRHDPAERPADAAAAAVLLSSGRADPVPRTRDGDPIEVLDQLPELPVGWGPNGPADPEMPGQLQSKPRATIVDVAQTAPVAFLDRPASADDRPDQPTPAGDSAGPHLSPPADGWLSTEPQSPLYPQIRGPMRTPDPSARLSDGPPAPQPSPGGSPAADGGADGRPVRRRGPILVAAASVAVVVVGVVLLLRLLPGTSTGDPSETPTSVVPSPATVTSPGTPTTPATGTAPGTTPATTPPTPTATATVTPENLQAGDVCTWQQEGDRRAGVDGAALVCTLADGSYQWRAPG